MTDDDRPRSDNADEKPGGDGPPAGKPEAGELKDDKPSEPETDGAPTPKAGTPSAPGEESGPPAAAQAGEDKDQGGEKKGEKADEKADEKEDDKKDDKKDGKGAARVPEHEVASPSAIEKLKERVARAEKEKKPKPVRRRRISDEERKALWHKAVLKKARKLKIMTDLLLLLLLAIVIAVHFVPYTPFIGEIPSDPLWSSKTGYELMRKLVAEGKRPWIETRRDKETGREVEDRATGSIIRKLHREADADWLAYGILAIPAGAALLVLLYLLDYLIWFGRLLPGCSVLWSFGSVGYLMYVRLPRDATWEMIGFDAMPAWYLLLVPLFLIGIVAVLRFVVSHRWKRYEFAGLPVPEHLKPKPPEEPEKAEKKEKAGKTDKANDADKADAAGKADEPAKAEEPSGSSEGEEADDSVKPGEGS